MKDKLNPWFTRLKLSPGVLGCGVRQTDGACVSQSFNNACPRAGLDQAIESLGKSLALFPAHGFVPRWLTWTFSQGRLRVVQRPDGLILGLAVQPSSPAAGSLDALSEEFLALNLGT